MVQLKQDQSYKRGLYVVFTENKGLSWEEGVLSVAKKRGSNFVKIKADNKKKTYGPLILPIHRVKTLRTDDREKELKLLMKGFKRLEENILKLNIKLKDYARTYR